ncbi:helix-turn-helix domain-containing protein [Rhizobium sp. VS19-DR104.2]|uniref:helix-turn-helix domain-containing protein n=1 Tax=unclassified Rhizobium TaxID=2613769 RepID=UPI001ADD563F|nr:MULTISPECIES: helix-turn-helix domain-containing protein [unclassified Rhizobium]MBO9102236.1 helix-turn-helix domain-containing protein [Rhizobium sp. L58/93]MBO9134595.1 helix-turn-helix domain-containing protein [Rhizobium sp. B209b/85]MBO9172268.1 helix-turn-helix domain-containing protein [Rhizobium sp. L245/93]MBO9183819.1 helix-turn-helix domain-containing protein [Rhizobium sp. E27B/91]MBZ5762538.1 helix-turn-helix domain-containing protein [Rhizobium sp. VS19-DR96]
MAENANSFLSLSLTSRSALQLLASEIQAARKLRGWTEADLAKRTGCSRLTIRAIEAGKPTVAVGYIFEAATMVGLALFGGPFETKARLSETKTKLELLPARVRYQKPELKDDF